VAITLTMPVLESLSKRIDSGGTLLRWIDLYAAEYVCRQAGEADGDERDLLAVLVSLVSFKSSRGHISLDISRLKQELNFAGMPLSSVKLSHLDSLLRSSALIDRLASSINGPGGRIAGERERGSGERQHDRAGDGTRALLVLDGDKLYLRRIWLQQEQVNNWLSNRAAQWHIPDAEETRLLVEAIHWCFGQPQASSNQHGSTDVNAEEPDWQALTVAQSLLAPVTLVTGGPGTGKTTTAARIIYCGLVQWYVRNGSESLSHGSRAAPAVHVLAPTGKAAARLYDSIRGQLRTLLSQGRTGPLSPKDCEQAMPVHGKTVHRFLSDCGALTERPNLSPFQAVVTQRPLRPVQHADIILIDEASMIDLEIMQKLLGVLPESCRVIFLGDHHQLPAVEPGAVFEHWVRALENRPQIPEALAYVQSLLFADGNAADSAYLAFNTDSVTIDPDFNPLCQLRKTYRFSGALADVAKIVRREPAKRFFDYFSQAQDALAGSTDSGMAVQWHDLSGQVSWHQDLLEQLMAGYQPYFQALASQPDANSLASLFSRYQILSCTLEGPLGVQALNEVIERYFYRQSQRQQTAMTRPDNRQEGWYHGKPVLVTRNDSKLGVYNGDVGFFVNTGGSQFEIHFPMGQSDPASERLCIPPSRLQYWQPAYAMSVHKSQGSEYAEVSVLLAEYTRELLSRPLLYTALTRAKERCAIWASQRAIELTFAD